MDELLVVFGVQPEISKDGTFDIFDFNETIDLLTEIIWLNVVFRF